MKRTVSLASFAGCLLAAALASGTAQAAPVSACLITKTDTNPFFVKMKEGATAKAKEQGVTLKAYAGKIDGASESEVAAIETRDARVALLALNASQPSVDVLRDQGFMLGFGIDPKDQSRIGDETDPRIVGHDVTNGNEEGGRAAMENLLQKDPTINVVHTINEPAAAGAYEALKAVGREKDVLIVSIDGGCPGVHNVADGVIGATSQQYPLQMAALGIEAIKTFADTGKKPTPTEGKSFVDTGVKLVTDKPVPGIQSIDSKTALQKCWG